MVPGGKRLLFVLFDSITVNLSLSKYLWNQDLAPTQILQVARGLLSLSLASSL
jgi:hypothetical protein